jgi:hypothetical protein
MDEMPSGAAIKQLFRTINECLGRKAGCAAEAKDAIDAAVERHGLNKPALLECIRLSKWTRAKRDAYRTHRDHYFVLLGLDGDGDAAEPPHSHRRKAAPPRDSLEATA